MDLRCEYVRPAHGGPLQFLFYPEGGDPIVFSGQDRWVTFAQLESAYHAAERHRSEEDEPLPDLEELRKLHDAATADQT